MYIDEKNSGYLIEALLLKIREQDCELFILKQELEDCKKAVSGDD